MTDLRAAAQQALEALCSAVEPKKGQVYARGFEPIDCYAMHEQAITALREALEQPEQEPSEWRDMIVVSLVREGINKHKARELADHFAAQPEQEPVAYYHPRSGFYWAKPTSIFAPTVVDVPPMPLYAAAERNHG